MAQTHSPTRSVSELPSGATGKRIARVDLQQRDVDGRVDADDIRLKMRPSLSVTVTRSAPLTT